MTNTEINEALMDIERDFLLKMEDDGISKTELARRLKTKKSNISRDFGHGFSTMTLRRLYKMAHAVGLRIVLTAVSNQSFSSATTVRTFYDGSRDQ